MQKLSTGDDFAKLDKMFSQCPSGNQVLPLISTSSEETRAAAVHVLDTAREEKIPLLSGIIKNAHSKFEISNRFSIPSPVCFYKGLAKRFTHY